MSQEWLLLEAFSMPEWVELGECPRQTAVRTASWDTHANGGVHGR